jgi:hypothetical protein
MSLLFLLMSQGERSDQAKGNGADEAEPEGDKIIIFLELCPNKARS